MHDIWRLRRRKTTVAWIRPAARKSGHILPKTNASPITGERHETKSAKDGNHVLAGTMRSSLARDTRQDHHQTELTAAFVGRKSPNTSWMTDEGLAFCKYIQSLTSFPFWKLVRASIRTSIHSGSGNP